MRLSWFSGGDKNETLKKDGFIFFKHWHGDRKVWVVDQFTPESYQRMKQIGGEYLKRQEEIKMKEASEELVKKYIEE